MKNFRAKNAIYSVSSVVLDTILVIFTTFLHLFGVLHIVFHIVKMPGINVDFMRLVIYL